MGRHIVKLDPEESVLDFDLPIIDFDLKAPELIEEDEDLMLEDASHDVVLPRGRYAELFFS